MNSPQRSTGGPRPRPYLQREFRGGGDMSAYSQGLPLFGGSAVVSNGKKLREQPGFRVPPFIRGDPGPNLNLRARRHPSVDQQRRPKVHHVLSRASMAVAFRTEQKPHVVPSNPM